MAGVQAQSKQSICTSGISTLQNKLKRKQSMQGSLFTKICKYIMGNEEPAYQVLSRSVLGNHNLVSTRKQKYIGTRKHNSEAGEGTKQEQRNEDSDGPRNGHFLVNVQERTLQITGGADECTEQPDFKGVQCGVGCGIVDPQSYRDALVGG